MSKLTRLKKVEEDEEYQQLLRQAKQMYMKTKEKD